MELKRGYNLSQLWADTLDDIQRVAAVAASKPTAQPPESVFLNVLGTSEPIRARLKQSPNLLQSPQPAAAATRETF